jgi:hypothetical protein
VKPKHMEGNMLILIRKSMERIQIGDNVVVTVLELQGNRDRENRRFCPADSKTA